MATRRPMVLPYGGTLRRLTWLTGPPTTIPSSRPDEIKSLVDHVLLGRTHLML
jgi:hypothetical protein